MEPEQPKAPGTTPGTATAGIQEAAEKWLSWVRIMPREKPTSDLCEAIGDIDGVAMVGGLTLSFTEEAEPPIIVSMTGAQSYEEAKQRVDAVVVAVAGLLGYAIRIESYEDGA